MGVRGLLSFIRENKAFDIIDLVEIAQKGNIEIIIDTHAFSRSLMEITLRKIARDYDNDYLLFPVGEYDITGKVYFDFHMAFKEAGVTFVWVVDGPKGVDEECTEQKLGTWRKRDKLSIAKNDNIFDKCNNMMKLDNLNDCRPIIDLEDGLEQLKEAGAEVIHLLQGEADDFIAHLYKERNSYAILTNDTDFVLFKDCNIIFEQFLSLCYKDDVLTLPFVYTGTTGKIYKKPDFFRCPIVNSEHMLKALKLSTHEELIATSILKGNDFTSDHSLILAHKLGLTKYETQFPHVTRVASYIKNKKINARNFGTIPEIANYLTEHPDLQDSINYSHQFYSLVNASANIKKSLCQDSGNGDGSLSNFLAEGISKGKINRYCYAIHHGSYFHVICTEQLPQSSSSILVLLGKIRSKIYPYLLNKRLTKVIEWRSRMGDMLDVPVTHQEIQANDVKGHPDGIKIFEEVWSHNEPIPLNYVETFGLEKGLILYILRYFHQNTKNENLQCSTDEFKALFVTVFYQYAVTHGMKLENEIKRDTLLRMKICPTARCLTIATWIMNMYYTAKFICGGALDLTEEFPKPVSMMNGSTFFAFYEISNGNGKRVRHLGGATVAAIDSISKEIMGLFSKEYAVVTEN